MFVVVVIVGALGKQSGRENEDNETVKGKTMNRHESKNEKERRGPTQRVKKKIALAKQSREKQSQEQNADREENIVLKKDINIKSADSWPGGYFAASDYRP